MKCLFYDTESSDLTANWGRLLCASFCELEGDVWTLRRDQRPWRGRTKIDDSKLALAIRSELESADLVCGWNSILHDIPLVNARLASCGERPVQLGEKYGIPHVDLMYYAGGVSLKVGGRRLATVAQFFRVDHQKTLVDGETWQFAAAGDHEAMDEVAHHCEADTLCLRDLWEHLAPLIKKVQFTLSEVWPFIDQIPSRRASRGRVG